MSEKSIGPGMGRAFRVRGTKAYSHVRSAEAARTQLATAHGASRSTKLTFGLVAFLITEGKDDALHHSYLRSYVELDRYSGWVLLYQDIGNPNVRGPIARELIEAGVLRFDPKDLRQYRAAVREAGGEMPLRRLEIDRLRRTFRVEDEPTPFLLVVSVAFPDRYAILRIPESVPGGSARVWNTVQSALSKPELLGVCRVDAWDEDAMDRLQCHLDTVTEQLTAVDPIEAEASLIQKRDGSWVLEFARQRAFLRPSIGLRYLHRLLDERSDVGLDALEVFLRENQSRSLAGEGGSAARGEEAAKVEAGRRLEVLDRHEIIGLRKAHQEYVASSKRAETKGRHALAQKFDEDAAVILRHIAKCTGLGGRPRTMSSNELRTIDSVRKAIGRAIRQVELAHPRAGEHLRSSVKTGPILSYCPASPTTWVTSTQ